MRSPRSHSSSVGPGVGRVFTAPGLLFPVAQRPLRAGATMCASTVRAYTPSHSAR